MKAKVKLKRDDCLANESYYGISPYLVSFEELVNYSDQVPHDSFIHDNKCFIQKR